MYFLIYIARPSHVIIDLTADHCIMNQLSGGLSIKKSREGVTFIVLTVFRVYSLHDTSLVFGFWFVCQDRFFSLLILVRTTCYTMFAASMYALLSLFPAIVLGVT